MARISKAAHELRMSRAFELRLTGLSLRQIGSQLGISYQTVQRDLDTYMSAIQNPKADSLRKVYTARYERMLAKLDPKVDSGDAEAINTAARLLAQVSKLNGVDMPTRTEAVIETVDPTDIEVRKLINEMNNKNARIKEELNND